MIGTALGPQYGPNEQAILNSELFRREPEILGVIDDGTNFKIRFRAAIAAPWVQVHVQQGKGAWAANAWAPGAWAASAWVSGGGATYDADSYVTSTVIDCRAELVQDVTLPLISHDEYTVFLIPVQYDGADAKVLYDGVSAEDRMVMVSQNVTDLIVSGMFTTGSGRIRNTTVVTTTYQILTSDDQVFCDTDGAAFTATLPVGVEGQSLRVMNTGTSGNDLTLAPTGTELLVGVNSNFTLRDGEALYLCYSATQGWC